MTGKRRYNLVTEEFFVESVVFSPDGKTLVSASYDKTIKIWDAATGTHLRTLEGHSKSVSSMAFSPDGLTLASGSHDDTVKLWNMVTGTLQQTLEGYPEWITSVTFAPHQLLSDLKIAVSDFRISLSRDWVTSGDENVLWLPGEYRSFSCYAVKNGKLALGYQDGRVLITGFHKHVK